MDNTACRQTGLRPYRLNLNQNLVNILDRSIPVLIGIFLFLNPFPHTTAVKEICFYMSVFIFFALLLVKKAKISFKTPLTLPLALFVAWVFVANFFALDKKGSMHDFYSHLLRYIILYYMIVNFFGSRRGLMGLSWIIVISVTLFSIGAVSYYYFLLGNSLLMRITNFDQIPSNLIGIFTVTAIVFSLNICLGNTRIRYKVTMLTCLVPLFAMTLLTQSRATLIALFLGLVLFFLSGKKPVLVNISVSVAIMGAMLLVVALTPIKHRFMSEADKYETISHNIRISINYITWEVIKDHPITGIGFGNHTYGQNIDWDSYNSRIQEEYRLTPGEENQYRSVINDPHNMFFSIAVRVGMVGLSLFLFIIFNFSRMCWKSLGKGRDDFVKRWGRCIGAAFTGFLVIGFFEPVFSHMQEVILFTLFSMITIVRRIDQNLKIERSF